MSDLILASALLAAVSIGLFIVVARLARRLPKRACDALAAAIVILIGLYIRYVWDDMEVARWLPFSSLIVLGNWFPLLVAILAGLAWVRVPPPVVRKSAIALLLFGAAAYSVYYPFRGQVPQCHDAWRDDVCLQTTQDTCSAACAATLLRRHGIGATEQEMAELCITRRGTTWWGLYRGLKLKTAGTDWDVEIVSGPASELRNVVPDGAILFVRLTASIAERNPKYVEDGWIVGASHSVVLFEVLDGSRMQGAEAVLVGDPSSGREIWPMTDLEILYQKRGLRLVKR